MEFIILTTFAIATYTDYKTQKIPNWLTYALIITGIAVLFTQTWQVILTRIIVSLALIVFSRSGGGDKKLLTGLCLSYGTIPMIGTYLISGCIAGLNIIFNNYRYSRSFFPHGIKYEFGYDIEMGGYFFLGFIGYKILESCYV